jgi:hypothetical protein
VNYYLTQEQYEQLREMYNAMESLESLYPLESLEAREAYGKLLDQIGNQKASDLV